MVGKSSIIRQFTEGNFIDIADTTVGVDFHARIVELSGGLYAVLDTTFSATCMYFYTNFNHKKGYEKLQFANNNMRRGEEMLSWNTPWSLIKKARFSTQLRRYNKPLQKFNIFCRN